MGIVPALWAATAVSAVSAVVSYKQGKDMKKANARAEAEAKKAQAEQEKLAQQEQNEADVKLEEQRARIVKGQQGRGGLLFGSELGTKDNKLNKTLG